MSEFDDLENMPGPAQLRTHAKELRRDLTAEKERSKTLETELTSYRRRDAFEAAREELDSELYPDLKLEDVNDLAPGQQGRPQARPGPPLALLRHGDRRDAGIEFSRHDPVDQVLDRAGLFEAIIELQPPSDIAP